MEIELLSTPHHRTPYLLQKCLFHILPQLACDLPIGFWRPSFAFTLGNCLGQTTLHHAVFFLQSLKLLLFLFHVSQKMASLPSTPYTPCRLFTGSPKNTIYFILNYFCLQCIKYFTIFPFPLVKGRFLAGSSAPAQGMLWPRAPQELLWCRKEFVSPGHSCGGERAAHGRPRPCRGSSHRRPPLFAFLGKQTGEMAAQGLIRIIRRVCGR